HCGIAKGNGRCGKGHRARACRGPVSFSAPGLQPGAACYFFFAFFFLAVPPLAGAFFLASWSVFLPKMASYPSANFLVSYSPTRTMLTNAPPSNLSLTLAGRTGAAAGASPPPAFSDQCKEGRRGCHAQLGLHFPGADLS